MLELRKRLAPLFTFAILIAFDNAGAVRILTV